MKFYAFRDQDSDKLLLVQARTFRGALKKLNETETLQGKNFVREGKIVKIGKIVYNMGDTTLVLGDKPSNLNNKIVKILDKLRGVRVEDIRF